MLHTAVPGYIHTSFFDYLRHFRFFLEGKTVDRTDLLERIERISRARHFGPDVDVVVSYSCRCLFDLFLTHLQGKKICVTPFLHTGFQKIIDWLEYETYVIDFQPDCSLVRVNRDELESCDAVLITHPFGNPLDIDELMHEAKRLQIPVFEDCVQGGIFGTNKGHPSADISAFSGGQDKTPVAFGGSLAVVRNKELVPHIRNAVSQLPEEKGFIRLKQLLEKLPIYTAYNSKAALKLLLAGLKVAGIPSFEFAGAFRQRLTGFVLDREKYLKKPSIYLLLSIAHSIDRDHDELGNECRKKRALFLDALGSSKEKLIPWHNACDYRNSSNFYYHVHVSSVNEALSLLDQHNYCGMPQQSWFVDGNKAPVAAHLKEHLILVPSFMAMKTEEIEELAKILQSLV